MKISGIGLMSIKIVKKEEKKPSIIHAIHTEGTCSTYSVLKLQIRWM